MGKIWGAQITSKYTVGSLLGSGAFSEVYECTDKNTKKKYALKVIEKDGSSSTNSSLKSEIDILSKLSHPNLVSLENIIDTPSHMFLVIELVTGGELFDAIVERGFYTELDAAIVVKQLLDGVSYLHQKGIVHRDLKPENILYKTKTLNSPIVITDFGLSKLRETKENGIKMLMSTLCGTPGYVAPEVLKKSKYSEAVDLWAIGVISYILLCGYPPFYDENNAKLFGYILQAKFQFDSPFWDDISAVAKDFVKRLLVVDPAKRMTIQECLNHGFITKISQKDLPPMKDLSSSIKQQLEKSRHARQEWKKAINAKKFVDIITKLSISAKSTPHGSPPNSRDSVDKISSDVQKLLTVKK